VNANTQAAAELEKNVESIARSACENLLNEHQEIRTRFGDEAQQVWTDHLNQRIMELCTALSADDYRMFVSQLAWSKTAMQARSLMQEDLRSSLISLHKTIESVMENDARDAALACLKEGMTELDNAASASQIPSALDPRFPHDRLALQYVQSVVAGNIIPGMQIVMDAVARGLPVQDAYLKVLLPAQQEVGRLWHVNELSVAEEHVVSHTTQRLMAVLSTRVQRKQDNGYTAIAGSVAGNIHDLGIRAISYLMEFDGWRVIYLGSDIPRSELPATINTFSADLILLSIALTTQIPALKRAIADIHAGSEYPVKIMVGGNGFYGNPELWRELGADGFAQDAIKALETAKALADSGHT
jgi:methanogenic corrinoid protein MtbC1